MCDYSLHNVKSRPAKVGDKLTTHHFNTCTRGFAAPEDVEHGSLRSSGNGTCLCRAVRCSPRGLFAWKPKVVNHTTAIFRQVNKDKPQRIMMRWNFQTGRWCY